MRAPASASAAVVGRDRPRIATWQKGASIAIVALAAVVAASFTASRGLGPSVLATHRQFAIVIGIFAASPMAGLLVYHGLLALRTQLEERADDLLERNAQRVDLTASIAEDLGELRRLCETVDQRLLASTVAIMLSEYDRAAESGDRQKALMNASQLIEKLVERLSPRYVRNAKPIALAVSVIGCASGVLKALIPLLRPQG